MKALRLAMLIMLVTGPALAQTNLNILPELRSKSAEEREQEALADKRYKELLRKIPNAATSNDPWGDVRAAETPAKGKKK